MSRNLRKKTSPYGHLANLVPQKQGILKIRCQSPPKRHMDMLSQLLPVWDVAVNELESAEVTDAI